MNDALINQLKDIYVDAAQQYYDIWHQDEDGRDYAFDTGGICDLIVDEAITMFNDLGFDAWAARDEYHCWVMVDTAAGVHSVDIPPALYEYGEGHVWTKIPGVRFKRRDVKVTVDEEVDTVLECAHLM